MRSQSPDLFEQHKVLLVTIHRKITRRMLPRGHIGSGLCSPARNPNQLLVLDQHVSQLLESSPMRVEVPDYLGFLGWRPMREKDSHTHKQ
jgi:hypothetical protein